MDEVRIGHWRAVDATHASRQVAMSNGDAPAPDALGFSAPALPLLRIDVVPEGTRVVVSPVGELDLSTADQLRDHLDTLVKKGSTRLVLDLRALEFMDSTGLALIVDTYNACRQDGCELSIIQGPPQVRRLFELTGLLDQLPFVRPRR